MWGRLTAVAAGREKQFGPTHLSGTNVPAASGVVIAAWPALRVLTGSVPINSWATDHTIGLGPTTPWRKAQIMPRCNRPRWRRPYAWNGPPALWY